MPKLVYLVAGALVAWGAAAQAATSKPRLLNLHELVSSEDYPSIAAANGDEGTVKVKIRVDRDGLATSCEVTSSSGHAALDEQTCALFRARARFAPARDGRGKPVASTYEKDVVWRLEGEAPQPWPRQAWVIRSTVLLDRDGEFVDCKVEVVALPPPPPGSCAASLRVRDGIVLSQAGGEVAAKFLTETHFFPTDAAQAPAPSRPNEALNVGQEVSEITIDPDGSVTQCKSVRSAGIATRGHSTCDTMNDSKFASAPAAKPLKGTFVVTYSMASASPSERAKAK